ncbi:hypothetical protein AB0I28_33970 [Phytomonospora sp. NPDC050363]|uniref:hypothetical protein n=1 Tax=Phytomonospora sp. NPDC050363 TaxID=3155642 RepID=UPI0033DA5778
MNTTTKTRPAETHHHHHGRRGWWPFTRHFLEMVAAMIVGMAVLGGARMGVLALLDAEIPGGATTGALLMALDMSIGMVAWMRFRGHRWAPCLEMTAAMFVPVLAALPLLWTGVIGEHGLMMVEHIGMLPAMLLAMLIRPSEYGR